jgi:hypothetical protein
VVVAVVEKMEQLVMVMVEQAVQALLLLKNQQLVF